LRGRCVSTANPNTVSTTAKPDTVLNTANESAQHLTVRRNAHRTVR
jgi:hypothetical protein